MAVQANEQGIVYTGLTDGHNMSVAYRPRGCVGYIPAYAECERAEGIGYKHRGNLYAIIGGNDRCRDMQRNNLWNTTRAWKHLFEIHSLPNEPMDVPHSVLALHCEICHCEGKSCAFFVIVRVNLYIFYANQTFVIARLDEVKSWQPTNPNKIKQSPRSANPRPIRHYLSETQCSEVSTLKVFASFCFRAK